MNDEPTWPSRWGAVLDQMSEELRSGAPRAQAYWAQQLAFAPVFPYVVALAIRSQAISQSDQELIKQVLPLALSMLGALPEKCTLGRVLRRCVDTRNRRERQSGLRCWCPIESCSGLRTRGNFPSFFNSSRALGYAGFRSTLITRGVVVWQAPRAWLRNRLAA